MRVRFPLPAPTFAKFNSPSTMKKNISSLILSSTLGLLSANAAATSAELAASVKNAVSAKKSEVVEIVSKEVLANPQCACEIVSSAIEGSKASADTVAAIVESAILAAPDQVDLVSKCALKTAPDASAEVYATVAKLGLNAGESSKAATVVTKKPGNNVLDFPAGPDYGNDAVNVVGPAIGLASGTAGGGGAGTIVIDQGGGSGGNGSTGTGGAGTGGIVIIPPVVSPNQPTTLN